MYIAWTVSALRVIGIYMNNYAILCLKACDHENISMTDWLIDSFASQFFVVAALAATTI